MFTNIENKIRFIANKQLHLLKKIGTNDLIAMEVKYHIGCLLGEMRNVKKITPKSNKTENQQQQKKTKDEALTLIFSIIQKIKHHFGSKIEIIKPEKVNESSIVIPSVPKSDAIHSFIKVSSVSTESSSSMFIGNSELSQIHKICMDIGKELDNIPDHLDYRELSVDAYQKYIPHSLSWIIGLLISVDEKENGSGVTSICQDIIYNRFKGKRLTPKHIGLGSMVHQETRSKKIIGALHACGHSVSYKDVLRIRNTIAQEEIIRYSCNDNCYIPRQLVPNKLVQFAADNIDILEETLDKGPTFHATQMIAFQQGPPYLETETYTKPKIIPYKAKLEIPENVHLLRKINYNKSQKVTPSINNKNILCDEYGTKNFIFPYNLAWIFCRTSINHDVPKNCVTIPQWSGFSKLIHQDDTYVTTYGYLPILPYVASDYDTIWTTMKRCSDIAAKLNNNYTIITFDQAIYHKAKEIQWLKLDECSHFVIRLGGFHIMMNFLKTIGQHMDNSGLTDVWLESNLYGDSTVIGIMKGKKWNKAIRAHKLTYESLLRILLPMFETWLMECKSDNIHVVNKSRLMANSICKIMTKQGTITNFFELVNNVGQLSEAFKEFVENQSSTFQFWCTYMEMVETLLEFIYSERTGQWDLHLQSFRKMLPWFFTYDHNNYARWGSVYLCDMLDLENKAPIVYQEFCDGIFVVKRLNGGFNRISVDQALEHVNKTSKDAGGIVGLTKNSTRLDEWYLSFNEIGRMVQTFTVSLKLDCCISSQNIETGKQRMIVDEQTALKLVDQFLKFNVFNSTTEVLTSISTKEVYPKILELFRLNAKQTGENALKYFVKNMDTLKFYKPLKKNNVAVKVPTSCTQTKSSKKTEALEGQQFLQRILAVKEMGRMIDYNPIFRHELTTSPTSLTVNGQLATPSNKSALGGIIENFTTVESTLPPIKDAKLCLIFDGMAMVQRISKPPKCNTFGELAAIFVNKIFKNQFGAQRVDVVFDNYKEHSTKRITRLKRGQNNTINKIIENENTPLPQRWNLFIHSVFNKKQLTNFFEGFTCVTDYKANFKVKSPELLVSNHEEADTRILLHVLSAKISGYRRCIVDCNDTDVLVLLLHFRKHLTQEVWMKTGKSDSLRYIPVHKINLADRCDTTSQFTGFGKRTCWKTYLECSDDLSRVGVEQFSHEMFVKMQNFVMKLYSKSTDVQSVDTLRGIMAAATPISRLPPTEDALKQHCLRVYFQTTVWENALEPLPTIPNFEQFGWHCNENSDPIPLLTTLPPFPTQLIALSSCSCKKDCTNKICKCRTNKMGCIPSCRCITQNSCKNPFTIAKPLMPVNVNEIESESSDDE
ncbi:hypothetical protein RN001_001663 [Aquatica leii]|uniref:Tesmin/TSO1-like CXC domain-containing protein n=1 Tax=Aquatica leii TaxID=1421715 RepID=A0AAN7SJP1_9COLE|nr:hypothetical protein RN001_001663 [Aquatica leii]